MFKNKSRFVAGAACLVCILAISSARADWIALDDYESYSDGQSLHDENGWQYLDNMAAKKWDVQDHADPLPSKAATDPLDSSNMAFAMARKKVGSDQFGRGAMKALGANSIDYGETGTIYLRAMMPQSDKAVAMQFCTNGAVTTMGYNSVAAQVIFQKYANTDNIRLGIRDGGTTRDYFTSSSSSMAPGEWYNFWIVMTNSATSQRYDVYYSEGDGPLTQVADNYAYRLPPVTGYPIHSFLAFVSTGDDTYGYIDDVYVSSGVNLTVPNPIPEPSALALAAMGLVGLLCYAWRRRR